MNQSVLVQQVSLSWKVCRPSYYYLSLGGAHSLWAVLFGDRSLHLNLCVTNMMSRIGFIFLLTHFGTACHTLLKKQIWCYELQLWFNDLNVSFCPDTHECRI